MKLRRMSRDSPVSSPFDGPYPLLAGGQCLCQVLPLLMSTLKAYFGPPEDLHVAEKFSRGLLHLTRGILKPSRRNYLG
ncbi:hypothetical protein GDO81_011027 [Engystomops pustulosus]|uniref:Uncharacterized protein n=1 Tax=Engystomops pustulosus TaxID=76066 RepID=A0AAV7C440_ENGPU|nr:hypothetical protein GDO81_011027 [Engystomops pustulosus]